MKRPTSKLQRGIKIHDPIHAGVRYLGFRSWSFSGAWMVVLGILFAVI